MVLNVLRLPLAGTAVFLMWTALGAGMSPAYGQGPGPYDNNYYSDPSGGASAALYPSPMWTPPASGRTVIPYQALAPQEFLWVHSRSYINSNPNGGKTLTRVTYSHNAIWEDVGSFFVGRRAQSHADGVFGHKGVSERILRNRPN